MIKKIQQKFTTVKNIPYSYTVFFILLFIVYITLTTLSHKKRITIAVGTDTGAYYVYAEQYKKELEKYGVFLDIKTTFGAVETQDKLIDEEVDFAFLQGGLEKVDQGVLALANIAHEPIWVLYKDTNITTFSDLKGKRINVCNPRSGTRPVAEEMLTELLAIDKMDLYLNDVDTAYELLLNDEIDAMFYVIARSSKSLQDKIKNTDIHIMNFENAESIRKYFIKDDMNESQNSYFKTIVVKKGSLDFVNSVPKSDKTILVKRTILATKNSSDEMVRLFLKVAHKIHAKEAFFHDEDHFINTHGLKYEQHEASKWYFENSEHRYERSKLIKILPNSYWLAQTLQKVEDFILIFIVPLALMGFFVEVLYPLSKIYTRRKINRWYRIINKMDTYIDSFPLDELREKKRVLSLISIDIHNTDNIDAVHLEAYYALQHQVKNMLENFEKRIIEKCPKEILV